MKLKGRQSTNIRDLTSPREQARIRALQQSALDSSGRPVGPAGREPAVPVTAEQIRAYEALMGPGAYRKFTESLYKDQFARSRAAINPPDRQPDRSVQHGPHTWEDDTRLPRSRPHGGPGSLSRRPPAGERTPEQMRQQEDEEAKWGKKGFVQMPSFMNSAANALGAGYDFASPRKNKNNKTAYQRYIESKYGPDVTSHRDPLAVARAAAGGRSGGIGSDFASAVSAGYNASSGPGAGMSSPPVRNDDATDPGSTGTSAAHEAFYRAISEAEGTTKYGYNTVYGGGNGVAGRPLTDMTIREVMNHQADMIHNTNHSPVGRFQITRDTLNSHYKNAGLSLDSKFDQSAQNKLALSIADKQGVKPTVWAGFNNNPGALSRAKQAYSAINQATPSQASYATSGSGSGITYNIRDRTSSKGLTSNLMGALGGAQKAARDAGLDHIEVVAGKGQGHLSHQQGTEADIVGYNADGSKWSKAQRVAVAQGAAGAGANRFGFYSSGNTLHVGMGAKGLPSNVVWNDKLRGVPGVNTFAPEERDFVGALRTGKLKSLAPYNASAYTSTAPTTPALQATATLATGQDIGAARGITLGGSGSASRRSDDVAAMQRDLNSRGAKLQVDGLEGPLTRQAAQQFYGSPTSVRTGGFTNRPTYTSGQQDQGSVPRAGVASTPSTNQPYTPTATTPRTPSYMNPYTNSTGGTNALDAQTPRYNAYEAQRAAAMSGPPVAARQVQTTAVDGSGYPPVGNGFSRPATTANQWSSLQQSPLRAVSPPAPIVGYSPTPQTPSYMNPYTMGTGGASAITMPTARIPVARPNYQPPQQAQQAPQQAVPTLIERLDNLVQRAERALGGNRDGSGSRSSQGSGSSRSGGGNYSGGNYGGQGGSRISEGVGGAYRNR